MADVNETINLGSVKISQDVIAEIAGVAAEETEGVAGISGSKTGPFGIGSSSKGVKCDIREGIVDISVDILVYYGVKMTSVAMELQSKIKEAVENMTGLIANKINVNIKGVEFLEEKTEETEE